MDGVDMTDIKRDGVENPFDTLLVEKDGQEKETPAASSAEVKQAETTPSQEGVKSEAKAEAKADDNTSVDNQNVPLNKDKRWKEMREQLKDRDARIEALQKQYDKRMAELETKVQSGKPTVPSGFKELFGSEDPDLYEKVKGLFQPNVDVNSLKSELLQEMSKQQQAQQEAQKAQLQWVEDELETLQEEGLKFERNDLLSVLDKFRPTDDKGNLDFRKGYELLQLQQKATPMNQRKNARKEIASKTAPKSSGDNTSSDVIDLASIRGKHWSQLVS